MPRQTSFVVFDELHVFNFNEGRGRCPAKLEADIRLDSIDVTSMKGGADAPPNHDPVYFFDLGIRRLQ